MFNEREVVSRILKGDMPAFTLLVKQYERLVFHVINRLVKDDDDVADICQEVFIKVHKSLERFQFESKLSTWIARIAYLTAITHLRKHQRQRTDSMNEDIENIHFTTEDPETLLNKKQTAAYVDQLIKQLPEQYRTVVTLYHLNEFSYPEIAAITKMPEGTVKSYLFRARNVLKSKLEVYFKNEAL